MCRMSWNRHGPPTVERTAGFQKRVRKLVRRIGPPAGAVKIRSSSAGVGGEVFGEGVDQPGRDRHGAAGGSRPNRGFYVRDRAPPSIATLVGRIGSPLSRQHCAEGFRQVWSFVTQRHPVLRTRSV